MDYYHIDNYLKCKVFFSLSELYTHVLVCVLVFVIKTDRMVNM